MKKHKLIGAGLAISGALAYVLADHFVGITLLVVGFAWFLVGRSFD